MHLPATLSVRRSRAPDSFRSWTKLGHYRTHSDTPVIFDLGHAIWSARGRETGLVGSVLSSLRDLHK